MYQFSVPMPYSREDIDKISDINKQVVKSKITSLYFALPFTDSNFTGFEQGRTGLDIKTDFEYWRDVLEYIKANNFEFIYLLNSPRPIDINNNSLSENIKKLDFLINKLNDIGFNKYRVANAKLLTFLHENYPELDLYSSTSFEYISMKQYQNFIDMYPYLKQVVLSHDVNKNFKLLKNLKQMYPNIEFEIMVNEGCLGGCPHRISHASETSNDSISEAYKKHFYLQYYIKQCAPILKKDPYLFLCKAHNIYPWEIKEYAKLGFFKFKLVGRDGQDFPSPRYFENCKTYLLGIDNYKLIENYRMNRLVHHIGGLPFPYIKDMKPYLPKIEHFKKYGHLCSSICGVECRYCYNCAEKMKKKLS